MPSAVDAPILLKNLTPSKTNPRKNFDAAALKTLTESVRQHGILQALLVVPAADGKYAIVCGERRYRAAKAAGLVQVPCLVRDLTDAQIQEMHLIENLEREDLNDIEVAQGVAELLELPGVTQKTAAAKLGKSQPWIANQLRLLRLPDDWQERIITRQISCTHALELLPVLDLPAVLKDVAERIEEDGPGNVAQFRHDVQQAMRRCSWTMRRGQYKGDRRFPDPKGDVLEQLDVRTVKSAWGPDEKRAFNVELYDKLQRAADEKRAAREAKQSSKPKGKCKSLSPADAKKLAEQFQRRIYRYKVGWLQDRISWKLDDCDAAALLRLVCYFTVRPRYDQRLTDWGKTLSVAGVKLSTRREGYHGQQPDVWKMLGEAGNHLENVVRETLKVWVRADFEGHNAMIDARDVEAIAADLGIDLATDWRLEQAYLELLNKEQIAELAVELKVPADVRVELYGLKRPAMIQRFLSGRGPMASKPPQALVNAKGGDS